MQPSLPFTDAGRTGIPPVRRGGESPWRRRHLVRLAFGLATAILIANALIGDRGLPANLRMQREYRELAETVATLKAANRRLRREAERLRSDPAAIEEVARRELGLIRPGERLFIVADHRAPASLERDPSGDRRADHRAPASLERDPSGDRRAPRGIARKNPATGDLIASNRSAMIVEPSGDNAPAGPFDAADRLTRGGAVR